MVDTIAPVQAVKSPFLSKMLWVQVIGIVAILIPASRTFIADNLGMTGAAWGFINIALRLITKDKLSIE
jgi:hypothetical protein